MTAVAKAMIVRGLVSALFSANLSCFFQIWLCLKVGGYPTWHFGTRKKMTLSDIHSDTVSSPYPTFAIRPGMPRMRYSQCRIACRSSEAKKTSSSLGNPLRPLRIHPFWVLGASHTSPGMQSRGDKGNMPGQTMHHLCTGQTVKLCLGQTVSWSQSLGVNSFFLDFFGAFLTNSHWIQFFSVFPVCGIGMFFFKCFRRELCSYAISF